jgi:hypothetical protein
VPAVPSDCPTLSFNADDVHAEGLGKEIDESEVHFVVPLTQTPRDDGSFARSLPPPGLEIRTNDA